VPGEVRVVSSEGGGVGGAAVEGCVCTSSRAVAEDERKRRGVPLVLESCRTHRRHVLNCRIDGVTDAIVSVRGVARVSARRTAARKCGRYKLCLARSLFSAGPRPSTSVRPRRELLSHHFRHGFHEDISADAGRHIPIEQIVNTAGCPLDSLHGAPLPCPFSCTLLILRKKCLSTPFSRSITTSTSPQASVASITTSATDYVPVTPFDEQTVTATIHQFPSLEPLRFETFPANHLYLPTRRDILHRAVVYEGDSTRLGTASTKNRHEVHGSRRKIRPQKGSGRARLGDKKSPMLRGGGVAFGPRPRDFATELPKKVYDLAWRTALSYRFRKNELIIVDNAMELESPSARLLEDMFKYHEKLRGKGRNLLVTLEERPLLEDALDQLGRGEQTLTWQEVDVKNLLELSRVIIERDALHNILYAHQEDLTHTSLQPWHKSFVRKSPPADLQSVIGWDEFKRLRLLDDEARELARPSAYEDVANKRYSHAASLPEGPHRTELTISAYNLLAEAKGLYFEQTTGFAYSKYASFVRFRNKNAVGFFPRVQALEHQRDVLMRRASEAAQVSRKEAEALELEALALEIQITKIKHEAAILAAQVNEHYAEAQRMSGDAAAARASLRAAGDERVTVEELGLQMLENRLAHARMDVKVNAAKGNWAAQKTAQATVDRLQRTTDRINAANMASAIEEDVAVDEVVVPQEELAKNEDKEEKELVDEAVKREERR
jgi:large subunit ribosomal protein L4